MMANPAAKKKEHGFHVGVGLGMLRVLRECIVEDLNHYYERRVVWVPDDHERHPGLLAHRIRHDVFRRLHRAPGFTSWMLTIHPESWDLIEDVEEIIKRSLPPHPKTLSI